MSVPRRRVLVIAPHPDDETLGVGGTIARLAVSGAEVTVCTVAAHMPPLYTAEEHATTIREGRAAHGVLGVARSEFLDFPALSLAAMPVAELHRPLHLLVEELRPEVVFLPFYDRHTDHRAAFDAGMVATRPVRAGAGIRVVAAYETLSETHWNAPGIEPIFAPNWIIDITDHLNRKLDAMACYRSQLGEPRGPRSIDALRGLAIFRGSQAGATYGEAFQILRLAAEPEYFL
jgi:LmbE family N-acetylglucosaminyl deacetylase